MLNIYHLMVTKTNLVFVEIGFNFPSCYTDKLLQRPFYTGLCEACHSAMGDVISDIELILFMNDG